MVALVCGFVLLLGLAVISVMGTILVRPIRKMTDVALLIAGGDLARAEGALGGTDVVTKMAEDVQTEQGQNDEVLQLARAFAACRGAAGGEFHPSSTLAHPHRLGDRPQPGIAGERNQTISRQAAALQETQVTAQEIKQTSMLAAQKAASGAHGGRARRGDGPLGRGRHRARASAGFNDICATRWTRSPSSIAELSERTQQIGGITQTVKDLADQSNMLALNAAIEAVRSGEHGKGFGVVAREIRSLADQSIQATNRVREHPRRTSARPSLATAARITEEGAASAWRRASRRCAPAGENLRELSTIVQDNAAAVRQIAARGEPAERGHHADLHAVTDLSG